MAKVDLHHFDKDLAYINGVEAGITLVKKVFELTVDERLTLFDESDVATILDDYNFAEISDLLRSHR